MAYTIMIVDDSETIREVLSRSIQMTKLPLEEIVQADNGITALKKLEDNWIDIIFTDINMPQMNGIELIDTLNKSSEYKDIPVVIVSTEGSKKRIEELHEKGIKGYLRKPFTPEKIRDVIIKTLGGWNVD
ncbi:MAG: response regulator [Chitinispirillia bacterium]|jgi:two-component system chemotaxis response regulator CheY